MFNFIKKENGEYKIIIDDINNIEKQFNIKFPDVLKDYYLKYNGSQIKECVFEINSIQFDVNEIIPIKYGTCSFEKEYDLVIKNEYISNIYVPFAKDSANQSYYFNLKDNKVYYISLDDITNPIFICDNIEEFFEILNLCLDNNTIKYSDNFIISNDNPVKIIAYSSLIWVYSKKKIKGKYIIEAYLSNNKRIKFGTFNNEEEIMAVFEKLSKKNSNLLCGYNKENIAKYNKINVAYKEQKVADIKGIIVFILFIILMILVIIYNVFYI